MTDIALIWDNLLQTADIVLDGPDLRVDEGLFTAAVISLGSDRRAEGDDRLPAGSTDRRGWWGDALADVQGDQIGSRLWLLKSRTLSPETLRLAGEYAREALDWMTSDGVAKAVDITVERYGTDGIALGVAIHRPDGTSVRFSYIWKAYS